VIRARGREDDVIEEADAEDLTRAGHPLGDLAVLGAGTGVPTGVGVREYQSRRAPCDCLLEELAWVDPGLVRGSDGYDLVSGPVPARIYVDRGGRIAGLCGGSRAFASAWALI